MKKNITLKEIKLKGAMLTTIQTNAVRTMIIDSMSVVYKEQGIQPTEEFYYTAGLIADEILQKSQMLLVQEAVFDKIVKKNTPKKATKKVKKVTKKPVKKVAKKTTKKKK